MELRESEIELRESDECLVQRMAERDEGALIELHRRYVPYLVAVARRMLKDPDEVQQSVQDAFVNAWDAAGRFDSERASARTWLVTIVHRLALNRLRGHKLETVPFESWDAPTRQPDHVERLYLQEAVGALAADERELIELAFFQGYSHSQLAEKTGAPLGSVKTKLRQALGKLRERLEEVR
jgi:RNA polymerase sigma-70 factor, ECF subfamily